MTLDKMIQEIELKAGYLFVVWKGPLELEALKENYQEILSACREHQVDRVLISIQTEYKASTESRYWFGSYTAEQYLRTGLPKKIAVVGTVEVASGFGGLVAKNRGIHALVTSDMEEALAYLEVDKT